jgi:putative transposase
MEAEYNHLNHTVGVQVPRRVHAEVPQEGAIREDKAAIGAGVSRSGATEGVPEEGHLMPDHVHMLISIPPKYSVAQIIGYMKGKSRYGSRRMSNARCGISLATSSGLAVTSSRPSAVTKKRSAPTSETRKSPTSNWISSVECDQNGDSANECCPCGVRRRSS